jgi:hypothetical protein
MGSTNLPSPHPPICNGCGDVSQWIYKRMWICWVGRCWNLDFLINITGKDIETNYTPSVLSVWWNRRVQITKVTKTISDVIVTWFWDTLKSFKL